MGLRVKTAIGYGLDLTGLDKKNLHGRWEGEETLWDVLSEKILQDIRNSKASDDMKTGMFSERIFFSEKYQDRACLTENREIPFHLDKCVDYDEEFLDKDKILFRPYPFGRKWFRSDDDIDYFVSGILDPLLPATETVWEETKRGIYPYIGLMRKNPDWHLGVETYMESCYMDRDPDYVDSLTTAVPLQLMFFVKHLFAVPDEELLDVFFQIKPVFARWWS